MDKLASKLRDDAGRIDARVSDELDARILASLNAVTPESPEAAQAAAKAPAFWWWSSLTGAAVALAIIVAVNLQTPEPQPVAAQPPADALQLLQFDWRTREAVLTSPLETEIDNLQADLKKAEEAVRQDIDRLF